jgi:hypothetical protein
MLEGRNDKKEILSILLNDLNKEEINNYLEKH